MLEHTLFSLPLAVAALLLETSGRPLPGDLLWIVLAVFGARNAANALNRLIDEKIDSENPRTAGRDLPAGKVKRTELWVFTILCALLFLLSAWMLNPLCLALVPVAAFLIGTYSFSKRFTWLCHYWLGLTCSAAVMGSFLAVSGEFHLRYFPLTAAAALWVAAFDILYAQQDIEHDRSRGIHSAPARLGRRGSLLLAALSHAGTVALLVLTGWFFQVRFWYFIAVGLSAVILLGEHLLVRRDTQHIPLAAYTLNQILSPVFLLFVTLDIYLPGGAYGF